MSQFSVTCGFNLEYFHFTQSNQQEHTEGLKYNDNQGHFINFMTKKVKSTIFHLLLNFVVLL